ncbi:leucine-rich repeat protein [Lysinibacillus irui]|uniref:Leucine-rich repeat protein n=1 Tax=Lysinibacillus irui TaxID=2998077 RepID=A0AAJ5RQB9_9BACI|nr:leucine-rich repeat protein [Lysinibacillus irui]WDV09278.1 leucine-rich repeat protein [Lysinibacillus irui]
MSKKNNKKIITNVGLAFAVATSGIVPSMVVGIDTVKAAESTAKENFTYSIVQGQVVITKYTGTDSTVVIPEEIDGFPVKSLYANLFKDNENISQVVVPDSVVSMGGSIFENSKVTSVVLGKGITAIPSSAFKGTSNLNSLVISSENVAIGDYAFELSGLTNFDFNKVTSVGSGAFANSQLKELVIEKPDIQFKSNAFKGVHLNRLELPEGMKEIPIGFLNGATIPDIVIPSTIKKIHDSAFKEVTSVNKEPFKGLNLAGNSNAIEIDVNAFNKVHFEKLFLSKNLSFKDSTFKFGKFGTLEVEEGFKGLQGFGGVEIGKLILGEGVEVVGSSAAFGSAIISELTLPKTLTSSEEAFYRAKIGNLIFQAEDGMTDYKLRYPNSMGLFDYASIDNLNLENANYIPKNTFLYAQIGNLQIGNKLKTIGDSAFSHAKFGNSTLDLPSVEYIESRAFDYSNIKNVSFGAVKHIGNRAFSGNDFSKSTIILPKSLNSIGLDAFRDILLPETTKTVDKIIVLNKFLNYQGYVSNSKIANFGTDGNIYGYEGSTTQQQFMGKGFALLDEELKMPSISSNIVNGTTYMGSMTPTFTIKDAELVEYTLNGKPYDGVSEITNSGENILVVKAINGLFEQTKTYSFKIKSNNPPVVLKTIDNQEVVKNDILKIDLNEHFSDPEGDNLSFSAKTSDDVASKAWVTADGELKFTSAYKDQYRVTVSATDGIGRSEELSFTVNVVDEQVKPPIDPPTEPTDPPKVPVDEGKLPPVLNYKLVENTPLVGIGTKKVIFVDGLLNEFDLDKVIPTIKTTDGKSVGTVYDSENKTLTFEALKAGFSNVQLQIQDEIGNKAALLFMIDVLETSNTAPNYIANGSIKLGAEAYVVKLDDVYADAANGESVTYKVDVTKDGEGLTEEVKVEEISPVEEEPVEIEIETELSTSEGSEGTSTEEPSENGTAPDSEVDNEATLVTNATNRKGLMAALDMMPLSVSNNDATDTFVFEVPAGVTTTTLHDDANLNIRLVNGKLVVEGKQVGMYNISVQAETASGTIPSPVNFSLAVLPYDNTGGGNNGGSEGGNTGGGDNGGSEGGNTGGGNSDGSEGGSTGGGNNGGSEGGSTGGGNNGGSEGGSTGGGNNGGSEGGSTGGGNDGGSEGGNTGGGNNGGSEGGSTSEGHNGGSDNGNTGEGNNEADKDSSTTPGGKLEENENGDLVLDIQPGNPSIKDTVDIVVDEDSIQLTIDGKQYDSAISNGLSSYDKKRVIREEGKGVYSTVPHYNTDDNKLKITTKNPYGLVITDRVAVPFKDVKGLFSFDEVEDLYNYLIVNGTTASTFSPNKDLKRGEFSAMLARALELSPESKKYHFKDVNVYKKEVQALYEAGIITGFPDGSFGESKTLTRQEAAAMIGRMLNYMDVDTETTENISLADMNKVSDYAKDAVQYLASQDVLVSGQDTKFNPMDNLTRAQMAKILMRSLRLSNWY